MEDREQELAAKEKEQRKIEELRAFVSRFLIEHPDLRGAALLANGGNSLEPSWLEPKFPIILLSVS